MNLHLFSFHSKILLIEYLTFHYHNNSNALILFPNLTLKLLILKFYINIIFFQSFFKYRNNFLNYFIYYIYNNILLRIHYHLCNILSQNNDVIALFHLYILKKFNVLDFLKNKTLLEAVFHLEVQF